MTYKPPFSYRLFLSFDDAHLWLIYTRALQKMVLTELTEHLSAFQLLIWIKTTVKVVQLLALRRLLLSYSTLNCTGLMKHKKQDLRVPSCNTTTLSYNKIWSSASDSDLAKVPPGDGDSVGDIGEMQPGSDVYRTTRTTGLDTRLIRGVIAL